MTQSPEFTDLSTALNTQHEVTLTPIERLIASGDIRVTESMKGFRPHVMANQKGAEALKALGVQSSRMEPSTQSALGPYAFGEFIYLLERHSLAEVVGNTKELHLILRENKAQTIPFSPDFLDTLRGAVR